MDINYRPRIIPGFTNSWYVPTKEDLVDNKEPTVPSDVEDENKTLDSGNNETPDLGDENKTLDSGNNETPDLGDENKTLDSGNNETPDLGDEITQD